MKRKVDAGRVLSIFCMFFKFGCFTFGGGWSIIAQIQQEYVQKRQWLTDEELLDYTSVGRSVPGMMITNTSVLFGYHMAGVPGVLAAVLGIVIPPFIVMIVIVYAYALVRENIYVSRALLGVRAAVVPIIICALSKMLKSGLKDRVCWVIAAVALALSYVLGVSNVLIVVLGALVGLAVMEARSRYDLH